MKITYFVHSITTDNEKGLATGWLHSELSEEGIRRAKELGRKLADQQLDAIFSSDLRRAVHSTELFFNGRLPIFVDWRLRECNYGDFDGYPASQFKKDREEIYITEPYTNGESYMDAERRMRSFLKDAADLFPDGHIVIVAHQAPQLALDVILKGKTWEQAIAEDWRKAKAWQAGWEYTMRLGNE